MTVHTPTALSGCQVHSKCAAHAALFGKTIMLELTAHEQQFHTVPADRWQELFSKFKLGRESALARVLEVSSAFLFNPSSATAGQLCQACSSTMWGIPASAAPAAALCRPLWSRHCMLPSTCAAWPVLAGGRRHHNAVAGRAAAGHRGTGTCADVS